MGQSRECRQVRLGGQGLQERRYLCLTKGLKSDPDSVLLRIQEPERVVRTTVTMQVRECCGLDEGTVGMMGTGI